MKIAEIEIPQKPKETKPAYEPYDVKVSEEIIVVISQFIITEYTVKAIEALQQDNIPFTTMLLFDGTPIDRVVPLYKYADIYIHIREKIHSLPHLWNILWGAAKLTRAKYLFFQNADMEIKKGSFASMYKLIKDFDIVSPVKIDNDRERFDSYKPLYDKVQSIVGFNDSSIMIKLDKLPFFPFDYDYAPYQFEMTALSYDLWRKGLTSVLDPNAVIFHHRSKDIEFCPKEREIGSTTWDKKKERFLKKNRKNPNWPDNEKKFFVDHVVMNSEIANKVGFPCLINGDAYGSSDDKKE